MNVGISFMMLLFMIGVVGGMGAFVYGAIKDKHRYQVRADYLMDVCVEFGIFEGQRSANWKIL